MANKIRFRAAQHKDEKEHREECEESALNHNAESMKMGRKRVERIKF